MSFSLSRTPPHSATVHWLFSNECRTSPRCSPRWLIEHSHALPHARSLGDVWRCLQMFAEVCTPDSSLLGKMYHIISTRICLSAAVGASFGSMQIWSAACHAAAPNKKTRDMRANPKNPNDFRSCRL